jgi:hypothetical protein
MVMLTNDDDVAITRRAYEWIDSVNREFGEALWANGPPRGFTEMDDRQEGRVNEELTIMAANGGRAAQQLLEHPVIDRRTQELEAAAREGSA